MKKQSYFNSTIKLILIFMLQQNVFAQNNWECQNPWPTCSDLMSIYPLTEDKIFIGGLAGTILMTEDKGNSWKVNRVPTQFSIQSIFFIDSLYGWTLSLDKLFKTSDGGYNWIESNIGNSLTEYIYSDIKFSDKKNGWLLISSQSTYYEDIINYPGQVFKTTDGGDTWLKIENDFKGRLFEISCIDSKNIFILSDEVITQFDYKSFLYKSNDGGNIWNKLEGPAFNGWRRGQMNFVDLNNGWIGQYKTTNGGFSWQEKFNLVTSINGIEIKDVNNIWIFNDTTIFHTTDAGEKWEKQDIRFETYLQNVKFLDNNIGWACGDGGNIYKTENGGTNWIRVSRGSIGSLYGVDFVDDNKGWAVGAMGTILHTENGGASWIEQNSGTKDNLSAVDFIDDEKGWAVGNNKILYTEDGGKQWIKKNEYQNYVFTDIQFLDTTHGWIVGTNGLLVKTNNGGETWEFKPTGVSTILYDVHFVDSLFGWISGKAGVLIRTTDGGNTWDQQNIFTIKTFQHVQFVDRLYGWVSSGDEISFYKTTDGGVTWNEIILNNYLFDGIHSFFFIDKNIGFAISFFFSDFLITNNGGQSWTVKERLPTNRINSLQFKSPKLGWGVGFDGTIIRYLNSDSLYDPPMGENIAGSFPNPFIYFTRIYFKLSYDQRVTITIFDLLGRKIKTLSQGLYNQGTNLSYWEAKGLVSGIYFVSIQCQEYLKTIKCILLK